MEQTCQLQEENKTGLLIKWGLLDDKALGFLLEFLREEEEPAGEVIPCVFELFSGEILKEQGMIAKAY